MDEQRWHTINQILDTALGLQEKTRNEYVRETCGTDTNLADQILSLLSELPESDVFWEAEKKLSETLLRDYSQNVLNKELSETLLPFKIGKYEATELIGRGGMGTVYKARRIDGEFERIAAIKVVNEFFLSDSTMERFRRERQILARLNHPNIAVLFDGGVLEDGRPYLIMELIEGTSITEYSVEHHLPLSERIELLKKLCLTVHYAHQNLIVHRDLKPSNILVNEMGELKVLDFGIARLLKENIYEENAHRVLSLQYASPEQIQNKKITTASDIYNLGLLGWELICNEKPLNFSGISRNEAEEIILNKPPNTLSQTIPSDLQAILQKAIQKKPEDRYSSALEFHQDLEDFQQKRPVKAVPGNYRYKTRRFVTRNLKFVVAAVVFVLSLSTLLFYHIQTVSHERDKALEEAEKARITSAFMSGVFENADYTRDDESAITSNQFLDDGVEYIHRDLGHYPDVQAQLLETVARVHQNLGNLDKAEELYLEVKDIRESLPSDHPDKYLLASCYHNLGDFYRDKGDYSKSEYYYIQALEEKQNNPDTEIASLGNTMEGLGWIWFIQGKTTKADSIILSAKSGYEAAEMNETMLYSNILQNLSWIYFSQGSRHTADSLFRVTLDLREQLYNQDAPNATRKAIAQTLHSLGWATFVQGNLDEAADFTQRAIEIRDEVLGRNHFETAWSINNLGLIERARNNRSRAEQLLQEAYTIRKEVLGESHPHTIQSLNNLKLFEQDLN
ncbi:serine/threonine-protein kinase [Gracilimonas sediminicola]|uniref:Serine/threonine-protein kinase n=1 Tax=Gracilimonas sediminicola TaxID=2952158 RepID=A0A9X2RDM8_9BACT|nr:serine/threonine-protein kinase [Gracilimonas sediminicola]MCP9291416.1 serine/threonine-protein kinase [Gracilimonas sediminicola]